MDDIKYVGWTAKVHAAVSASTTGLARACPISANAVTVVSMLLWLVACVLVLQGLWIPAAVLGLVSSLGDSFDGTVARVKNQQGVRGAFLDFYADRLGDMTLFAALAWHFSTDRWVLAGALANVGLTQFSSMFRNSLKLPDELKVVSGIALLTKAFPPLNLRRAILAPGILALGLGFEATWPLAAGLGVVALWCLAIFTLLYVKVGLASDPAAALSGRSAKEEPEADARRAA